MLLYRHSFFEGIFCHSLTKCLNNRLYILVECLLDWNIDTKLSIITLDNYSTNDCMIEKIKGKLQLGTLIKEEVFLHIRCCAHILNLIVKDGLGVVKDGVEKI